VAEFPAPWYRDLKGRRQNGTRREVWLGQTATSVGFHTLGHWATVGDVGSVQALEIGCYFEVFEGDDHRKWKSSQQCNPNAIIAAMRNGG
jgi:hypothetical protein